jgi:hypothetical protein
MDLRRTFKCVKIFDRNCTPSSTFPIEVWYKFLSNIFQTHKSPGPLKYQHKYDN